MGQSNALPHFYYLYFYRNIPDSIQGRIYFIKALDHPLGCWVMMGLR